MKTEKFSNKPFVVHFDAGHIYDPTCVGSKASALGKISKIDCSLPRGFVITTDAFRFHLEQSGLHRGIEKESPSLGSNAGTPSVEEAKVLQDLIRNT